MCPSDNASDRCADVLQGAGTEPGSAPLDLSFLQRYTLGDMALQKEILELFAGQLAASLGKLREAETAEEWLRAAHTLKGSARTVGAATLAESAQNAETIADVNDSACRQKAMARIEADAREVAAFLGSPSP